MAGWVASMLEGEHDDFPSISQEPLMALKSLNC
jgi:hypothetical protein